jgi:hypothetical protein
LKWDRPLLKSLLNGTAGNAFFKKYVSTLLTPNKGRYLIPIAVHYPAPLFIHLPETLCPHIGFDCFKTGFQQPDLLLLEGGPGITKNTAISFTLFEMANEMIVEQFPAYNLVTDLYHRSAYKTQMCKKCAESGRPFLIYIFAAWVKNWLSW